MQQVGFTQAGAAIEQQRVIGAAGLLGYLQRRGVPQFIRFTANEVVEAITLVQPGLPGGAFLPLGLAVLHRPGALLNADFDEHPLPRFAEVLENIPDAFKVVGRDMVPDICVGREQMSLVLLEDRPDPNNDLKTEAIQQWMETVIVKIDHYTSEHYKLLKDNMTQLELALWKAQLYVEEANLPDVDAATSRHDARVKCGANVIIPLVLPFLNDQDVFPLLDYDLEESEYDDDNKSYGEEYDESDEEEYSGDDNESYGESEEDE